MKPPMLLFWIFAVPVHTFVLQPSVNVTVLRNVSVEGDLWAEQRLDQLMEALNTGKEKRSEEKATVQGVDEETDTVHSKRTEEHDIKKTESEKHTKGHTESDVIKKEVKEKEDQQGQNLSDAFLAKPVLTAWNTTYLQEVEGEEHLSPTVNQYTTPPAMATAFQPVLHLLKESVTLLPSKAPPSTFLAKLPKKAAGAKLKDNTTLKAKKKKSIKGKVKTTPKVLKKAKKAKKLKRERKLKPTTPSYFPYFEDHYCPSECSCYGRVVQCSDKDLGKIPYGIPFNSRYILLMNNHIDSIQLNLLSEYDSMEFLVLSNNRLRDASIEGSFEGTQSLKRLYVERNLLQSIPTDLPVTLEELRLDGNQISVMSDAAFGRCPGLLILSLSNNSLGNKSSTIPPGVLLPLGKLRTLTLSYNQLSSVPLQLPLSLQELYLRGNRIQSLQGDMFWGVAELQVLDLSANRLTNKGLGKAALLNASNLESLNLEGNSLKQVPHNLPWTIKTLNLEGNLISSITKDAFISLPQLEHLGLARNKITKVALGAFRVLPLLHQLDMSHNALQQVPRQLPLWLHSATFANNKIHAIPRDAFCWGRGNESPLSRLVKVHLEYNMIDLGHLDTLAFRCLRGFQVVQFY
ncbi:decorin [Rhinichthys klamathensis goyatoka]|uniref:decorin n=1 Tax=Rhinichthys klamathensis goyatoka TaxID=3034132 RepID=UPI0024B57D0C|nr:decorin [Rhinichthys klamathensis goyatoka]